MKLSGFDSLLAECEKLRLECQWLPPARELPNTEEILGVSLDRGLKDLLSRNNGGRCWEVSIYGGEGNPNELLRLNKSLRSVSDDFPNLKDFVIFGQVHYQATYLAVVPAVMDPQGFQAVVYLDLNEEMIVAPLASNVDRCFELFARYLRMLAAEYGSIETGTMERPLPWDVPEMIATDQELVNLLARGRLDSYLSTDTRVTELRAQIGKHGSER